MKIGDICYWRTNEESTSTFKMKSRETMVLIFNWRASETLSGVYKFELVRYIRICMEVRVPY